jgi:hypothetical protein
MQMLVAHSATPRNPPPPSQRVAWPLTAKSRFTYRCGCPKDVLAAKHALFFRTIFAPTLAGALERSDDAERRLAFLARLESGLKRRLADRPQPIHSRVETIVLAKSAAAPA